MKNTTTFGQHLIFDAYGCDYSVLNSAKQCKRLLEEIVEITEMHKLTEAIIVSAEGNTVLGGKDPGGFTGFIIIEESHISIHTFAKRGFVTIDVYSCKEFDARQVIEYLELNLKPKDYDVLNMQRGLKYPLTNIY